MQARGWTTKTLGACLLAAAVLSACAPVYRNHGYIPPDEELALIEVGRDSRQNVADTIGRPGASGLLNDKGWYYVQSRFKHFGPYKPEETERQVVAVTFTDAGIVENVERFGLEQGRVVALSRRVTDTNIKGIGVIRQIFANFGRFVPGQFLGSSPS